MPETPPATHLPALLDQDAEGFLARHDFTPHLASLAVRSLASHPHRQLVVDYSTGRKALRAGLLLAVAYSLAQRWRDRFEGQQRVGVVFPIGIGGLVTNLALALLDKTAVNFNFTSGRQALEKAIAKAGVTTVISAKQLQAKVKDFPWPEATLDLPQELKALSKPQIMARAAQVYALPGSVLCKLWQVPQHGGERELTVLFSSGSTGDPKGVVLTHANVLANVRQIQACELLERQVVLACLPIFHSFGFTVTLWFPLLRGLRIVCVPSPLETRGIAEAIQAERCSLLLCAPTFLRPFFAKAKREELESLEFVVGGAEKTPQGFAERWQKTFGSRYLEGYGLTETSPVVSVNLPATPNHPERIRDGSVGQLFAGMRARVVDETTGAVQARGQAGVLQLQGPNVFNGYLEDPEKTAEAFDEGWYVTGDWASIDEDGYLHIEGRLSRFSKLGGEMVPHGTVEHAIAEAFELDQGDEPVVAVSAGFDAQKGERLVVLHAVDLCPNTLRERLSARGLPNLWIPRCLKRVEKIPRLVTGKLDLRALKDLAQDA